MEKELKISADNALAAYNNANADGKALLEHLFGKELFAPKDIREKVKTFEDAVAVLGNEHMFVQAWNSIYQGCEDADDEDIRDVIAYHKLRIIVAALNEGWKPKFEKGEYRWYPWFDLLTKEEIKEMDEEECRVVGRANHGAYAYGGLVYSNAVGASSSAGTSYGSRLAFRTEELAEYAGKQFAQIFADFIFA